MKYGLLCPTCWHLAILPDGGKEDAIEHFASVHARHLANADLIEVIEEGDFPRYVRMGAVRHGITRGLN